jgi:hypothetical protein
LKGRRFGFGPGIAFLLSVLVASTLCTSACGPGSKASKTAATTPTTALKPATADDAKQFVQRFYDWYVPYSAANSDAASLRQKETTAAFAPELLRALLDDEKAQSKRPDSIVGLDFDPVTNSQDPCERYEAFRAHQTGDTYWVDVRSTAECAVDRKGHEADVTVQLTCTSSTTCSIFNFQYPGPPPFDLRSELKQLSEQRVRETAAASRTNEAARSTKKR